MKSGISRNPTNSQAFREMTESLELLQYCVIAVTAESALFHFESEGGCMYKKVVEKHSKGSRIF